MDVAKKTAFILALVLFTIALPTNPSLAQEGTPQQKVKCKRKYCRGEYHGRKVPKKELKKILIDHANWVETVYEPALKKKKPGVKVHPRDLPQEGRANLCEAKLREVKLKERTNLRFAILRGAKLFNAVLSEVDLKGADLSGTYFGSANLSDARLVDANLSGAIMWGVNLKNAVLRGADLDSVFFSLDPKALPIIPSIAQARNLSKMRYGNSPHSLVELREAFKKAGLRRQEREITYAIERTRRQQQMRGDVAEVMKGVSKFILFELTSDYGMSPGRPLWIMIFLMIFCSAYYEIVLKNTQGCGICQVRQKDGKEESLPLCTNEPHLTSWFAFYFSLLSAFHIGWRDFSVGNWLVRMQRKEYTLRATGWARTVSGGQSLISVYMMALSILTYFGRPFEG